MQTLDIIQEIKRLSLTNKFYVIEETLKAIKKEEMNIQYGLAVNELSENYSTDKELTAFTAIDFDQFYEAK
ncbi:MAG: hypothetical protein ABIO44_10380 [Saprospiraceae bacterium]